MARPRRDTAESLLRGGLVGIALVTAATVAVSGVAAVIALLVSLLY